MLIIVPRVSSNKLAMNYVVNDKYTLYWHCISFHSILGLHDPISSWQKLWLKKKEHQYLWFPPVRKRHMVRTAMGCGMICVNTAGCYYFNVERMEGHANTMRHCDITSTHVSYGKGGQPEILSEEWDAYIIA